MTRDQIQREYPYFVGVGYLVAYAVLFIVFGVLSLSIFYFLAIHPGTVVVGRSWGGHVELGGTKATTLSIVGGLVTNAFAAWMGYLAWKNARRQRIAFTSSGILLPRTPYSTKEEYVPFTDIRDVEITPGRERTDIVVFLRFSSSNGQFSITREKLTREAFDEICTCLQENVRIARPIGQYAQPPGSKFAWRLFFRRSFEVAIFVGLLALVEGAILWYLMPSEEVRAANRKDYMQARVMMKLMANHIQHPLVPKVELEEVEKGRWKGTARFGDIVYLDYRTFS
jgi:hypothetical protein